MSGSVPQSIVEQPPSVRTEAETSRSIESGSKNPVPTPRVELDAGVVLFGLVLLLLLGIPISLALLRPRSIARGRRRRAGGAASETPVDVWHEAGRRAMIDPDSFDRENE